MVCQSKNRFTIVGKNKFKETDKINMKSLIQETGHILEITIPLNLSIFIFKMF